MLGNDCFNCGCTPVKCRMPNELLMTVKGFNYSWSNTPAGAGSDVPSLSERTKCGPCVSPGIITCGDADCCPNAASSLCNQDEGCCGSRAPACDPPPVNSLERVCCTWDPLGNQNTCSVQYFCNCVHDNSRKHRWPRDQWTGAPMCETSGHPICGQYSHLCQQPPEPVEWVKEGFFHGCLLG